MNANQKVATIVAAGALIYIANYATWTKVLKVGEDVIKTTSVEAPLWKRPDGGPYEVISLDEADLYAEALLVGVLYALAYAYLSDKPKAKP
ncbi:MAG TPA: hypothetical protein VGR14_17160 [Verrucomicrobiae bacterium]|jgi:hypothetical protein|nr:hypothetical protein [Verrucomicrobiae bacterium]